MKRLAGVITVLFVAAGLVVGGIVAVDRFSTDSGDDTVIDKPQLGRATVVRTDLVERETFEGTLRFRDPRVVVAQLVGTVTGGADEATIVDRGDILYEVDGQPVVVFLGERPMWRPLAEGVVDGADVYQLERNLMELGYAPDNTDDPFEPDEVFDSDTAEMIREWRADLGLSDDPFVELGRIAYLEGPARLGGLLVPIGGTVVPGTPIIEVTASTREIGLLLPVDRQDLVAVGDPVAVLMPSDEVVTGIVETIGRSVVSLGGPGGGERAIEVIIAIASGGASIDLDESPVDIDLETDRAAGVLAVPVNALLALADGGYGLQVDRGGEPTLIGVEIGTFVGGLVEVTGNVSEGDTVLVPK